MKNKYIKYIVYVLFILMGILGCYFIIKDANWIFGDDHEFLVSTAIGQIESIKAHMGGGRFNPIQHYDYNILTIIPFGSTAYAHYIFVALSFALLTWLFAKNSYLISKTYQNSPHKIWGLMLFSCLCFFAFLMNPNVAAVFLDIIFPERLLLVLFAGFIYFYITAMDRDEKWRYICALLCAVYATYMKEVVAGAFLVFAVTNLLFSYKNISKTKKQFYIGLVINFLVYLALYYVLIFRTNVALYNDGRSGLTYFDNVLQVFNQQKFLIPVFIFAIYRAVRVLFYKDYKHLSFDALLFMAVAYTSQYFILNLNSGYYFNPSILLGYFVMFYWLACNFDANKWRFAVALLCLISIGYNYQSVQQNYNAINVSRNSFIPNMVKLIKDNDLNHLKIYTEKQGNFNDQKVYHQYHVLNAAISYLLETKGIEWISAVSDVSQLTTKDFIFFSDFETLESRNRLNQWLLKNDFSQNDKRYGLAMYSKQTLSAIAYGVHNFNKTLQSVKTYGLSGIESFGRWSDGQKVLIKFMVPKRKTFKMHFDVFPFLVEGRSYQNVSVFVNNKRKAVWRFEQGKPMPDTTINVSYNDIGRDKVVSVVFNIDKPVSPKDLGVSSDIRILGLGFRSFEITE